MFAGALRRLFGGSQPNRIEFSLIDVANDAIVEASIDTTVCLSPEIVNGERLEFNMSHLLKNTGTIAGYNLLGHLRNVINVKDGECIVIMSITRTHVHNELDAVLNFDMIDVFDNDAETQVIRDKIDKSMEMDNGTTTTTTTFARRPPPPSRRVAPATGLDSLEPVVNSVGEGISPLLLSEVTRDASLDQSFQGDTADEIRRQADNVTVRGRHVHRNLAEASNVIHLQPIPANTTLCHPRLLYRASIQPSIVKWFAGQDAHIQEPESHVHHKINSEDKTRADRPVVDYAIYSEDHSLIIFIRMFADDLDVKDSEISLMVGDRDATTRWCQVDRLLVERARSMILYVVYAQMYYTTLQNCSLQRVIDANAELAEHALVMKLAAQWGLRVDSKTKKVSDWPEGAYRPVVVVTLHVEYFVVRRGDSRASAAALHKNRTVLSHVK